MTEPRLPVEPTPRTNAQLSGRLGHLWIEPDFARQLERELTAANAEIERLKECAGAAADILLALVVLKSYKDAFGKTEYYDAAQPASWQIARDFLMRAIPVEYESAMLTIENKNDQH